MSPSLSGSKFFKIAFAKEKFTRRFPISNVPTGNTNLCRVQNVAYDLQVRWFCSIPKHMFV